LIGSELVSLLLQNGESIHYLTTSKKKISNESHYKGFFWNPEQGMIDENALIGVDAIIHLAGASVSKRWTNAYKQEIVESRVLSANLLFKTLKNNPHQVRQIISASAIGIYPDSLDTLYTEDSKKTDLGFLGKVVVKWEESIDIFKLLDIKVCKLRTGLVLSQKGGALPEMEKPIKWGIGSPFGSGKQMQSWIHIDDLVALYYFAVKNDLVGIYNAVAPNPVSNETLTKAIADKLHKPLFMPNVPRFIMKIMLGEMHQLLFSSQNVSSQKIRDKGFTFKFQRIDEALEDLPS
jgi:uncharacterized protein (TIGR01777 family)